MKNNNIQISYLLLLKKYWFVAALFLIITSMRLFYPGADPPVYLESSGGLFGDEAAHAFNARNKVLFGHWITDEFNPVIFNPTLTALEYLSFSVFGVGLIQLRLVNMVSIIMSFLILFAVLKKNSGIGIASISTLILGLNYVFIMYNRLGLNDTFIVLPMTATLFFWQKGLKQGWFLFLAGITSFACYITKASSLYFILAAFASLAFSAIQQYQKEKEIKNLFYPIAFYFAGVILSYACWYILFYMPFKEEFTRVGESWVRLAWPSHFGRIWKNLDSFTFAKYMANTPVEFLIVWIYVPIFIYGIIRDWKKTDPLELFLFFWLIGGYIALNALNYKPLRYFVAIIPPMCVLASFALCRFWNLVKKEFRFNKESTFRILFLSAAYIFWIPFFIKKCIGFNTILRIIYPTIGITVFLILIFSIFEWMKRNAGPFRWNKIVQRCTRSAVIAIIAYSVYINGSYYLRWFNDPKYTVIETSREIGSMLDHAYIAGLWSPLATIENRHSCLYVGNNWFNYTNTFDRFPITHLFLWDGNNKEELRFFQRAYPEIMENANLVKIFSIKALPVRLFKINSHLN